MTHKKHINRIKKQRGALASMIIDIGCHHDISHPVTMAYIATNELITALEKLSEEQAKAFEQRAQ